MNKLHIATSVDSNKLASDFLRYRFDQIRFGQKLEITREQEQPPGI